LILKKCTTLQDALNAARLSEVADKISRTKNWPGCMALFVQPGTRQETFLYATRKKECLQEDASRRLIEYSKISAQKSAVLAQQDPREFQESLNGIRVPCGMEGKRGQALCLDGFGCICKQKARIGKDCMQRVSSGCFECEETNDENSQYDSGWTQYGMLQPA